MTKISAFYFLVAYLTFCSGNSHLKCATQISTLTKATTNQFSALQRAKVLPVSIICDERFNSFRILEKSAQKDQNRKNEQFLLILSLLTGTTTAAVILKSKLFLSILIQKWPQQWWTPAVGSIVVSFLLLLDKNLSVNPFTLPIAINVKQINKVVQTVPSMLSSEWSALSSSGFSVIRQMLRLFATMLAVSSGNSLGFTAAAVEVGMTVAYLFGALLPVAPDGESSVVTSRDNIQRRKYLLLAGAAAGIAVNSNAPFTGILYSAEIASNMLSTKSSPTNERMSGEVTAVKTASLLVTVTAAVLALRMWSHPVPALRISSSLDLRYLSASMDKVPMFLAIGALSGCLSYLFTLLRTACSTLFSLPHIPSALRWMKPLLGGLLCSLSAYMGQSHAMGLGYVRVNDMLSGEMSGVKELVKFLGVKFVATAVSISSFPAGGLVAPSMFLGSALGALFYHTLAPYYSNLMLDNVSVYLLLGAASYLAAIFRAPLTASMLVVEMTNNQALLIPLLIASSTAGYVTHRLHLVDEK